MNYKKTQKYNSDVYIIIIHYSAMLREISQRRANNVGYLYVESQKNKFIETEQNGG